MNRSNVAARRAVPCPSCSTPAGTGCPGTRDHDARYRAAGQSPPGRPAGALAGLFLREDSIRADLAWTLTKLTQDRAMSYPDAVDTPARRAAYLEQEVLTLLRGFAAAPER